MALLASLFFLLPVAQDEHPWLDVVRELRESWEEDPSSLLDAMLDVREELIEEIEEGTPSPNAVSDLMWITEDITRRAVASERDDVHRIDLMDEVLDIALHHEDRETMSWATFWLSELLWEALRFEEALERLEEAQSWISPATGWVLLRLAAFARADGRWSEARAYLDRAEAIKEDTFESVVFQQELRGGLAQLLIDMGLMDLAIEPLELLEEAAEQIGRDDLSHNAVLSRLNFELASKNFERVIELVDQEAASGRFLFRKAIAQQELFRRGDREASEAMRSFETIVSMDREVDGYDRLRAMLALVSLGLEARDFESASVWLEKTEAFLKEWEEGGESTPPAPESALYTSLKGAYVRETRASDDVQRQALDEIWEAYDSFLEQWDSMPPRPGGIGPLNFSNKQIVLTHLIDMVLAVEGEENGVALAFGAVLRSQALGSLTRLGGAEVPSLDDVRDALVAPQRGLLVYVPSILRTHVFALDANGLSCHRIDPSWALIQKRRDFLDVVTAPPIGEGMNESPIHALSASLIPQDLRERIQSWKGLTVCGLSLIGNTPIEALSFPGELPLGMTLEIDSLPSVPFGVRLAATQGGREAKESADVAMFGAPSFHPDVSRAYGLVVLPSDDPSRIDELRDMCDGGSLHLVSGEEATFSRLRQELELEPDVLSITTHGVFNIRKERSAGLALAPDDEIEDGLVWCSNLESLKAPRLVLLSACGAASGRLRMGDDGMAHLGGALFLKGAQVVVLSRWELDYEATTYLTTQFLRYVVQEGHPPARAMMMARRKMATVEGGRWAHPYYHGLLRVVGLGHQQVVAPPPRAIDSGWGASKWVFGLVGVLVLAVVAIGLHGRSRRGRETSRNPG